MVHVAIPNPGGLAGDSPIHRDSRRQDGSNGSSVVGEWENDGRVTAE